MKIALLDARQGTRDPGASMTVAYRNMMVLAKELHAPLYVDADGLKKAPDDFDAIICGFGSTSCERTESVAFLKRNHQAKLWWLVGEYEQALAEALEWQSPLVLRALDDKRNAINQIKRALGIVAQEQQFQQQSQHQDHGAIGDKN
jgi:hypothetical protein